MIIGLAAGLLLAPKSGSEIRRELFGGQLDILAAGTETGIPVVEPESSEELSADRETRNA
jgi:gas vesicle protein